MLVGKNAFTYTRLIEKGLMPRETHSSKNTSNICKESETKCPQSVKGQLERGKYKCFFRLSIV